MLRRNERGNCNGGNWRSAVCIGPEKNLLGVHRSSKVNCFCCPKCGYIEFYAVDPTIFKER